MFPQKCLHSDVRSLPHLRGGCLYCESKGISFKEIQLGSLQSFLKWLEKTSKHHFVHLCYFSLALGLRHHLRVMSLIYRWGWQHIVLPGEQRFGGRWGSWTWIQVHLLHLQHYFWLGLNFFHNKRFFGFFKGEKKRKPRFLDLNLICITLNFIAFSKHHICSSANHYL